MNQEERKKETADNISLGTVKCGKCEEPKPFPEIRWDKQIVDFLCQECRNNVENFPQHSK